MTATGHAIIGTSLAAIIPNPLIGIPVAILSHVFADAFPHWDTGTNMKKKSKAEFVIGSFIDLGLSFFFPFILYVYLFPQTSLLYIYIMVIAAQGFDWASAPYLFLNWKFPPFSWAIYLQRTFDNKLDKPRGVIYQIIALICVITISASIYHLS
ncbi:MAG: hypothetical protein KBC15_00545 [Candidatus Levybacteria bacterium]|nr:hypothetical protein [Candidatus Levybacteria bacterium]